MAKDMKTDEDVEIVLDDADVAQVKTDDGEIVVAPQEDAPVVTGDPPAKAVEPSEGIEALKSKLVESERARLESEAREREAVNRANSAGREVQDTQLTMVNNAIDQVKSDMDRMEADYAQAMTDQDFAAAAKIQRGMSEHASKLTVLEGGKHQLEAQAKNPVRQPAGDIVEQYAQQCLESGSPKSAAWIRAHPEYARDPRMNRRMLAAHNMALANDIPADSDDYFDFVETNVGMRREVKVEEPVSAAAEQVGARTAAPPAAPVSRGNGANGSSNPNTVRLTAEQREVAAMNGQTEKEYAVQLLRARKNGEIQ